MENRICSLSTLVVATLFFAACTVKVESDPTKNPSQSLEQSPADSDSKSKPGTNSTPSPDSEASDDGSDSISTIPVPLPPVNSPPVGAPQGTAKVTVLAFCSQQNFNLSFQDTNNNQSQVSLVSFPGCDRLVNRLNGKTFPSGQKLNVLQGGSNVFAGCSGNNFILNAYSSTISVFLENIAACEEIRDQINSEKL